MWGDKLKFFGVLVVLLLVMVGCSSPTSVDENKAEEGNVEASTEAEETELNLYIPNYYNSTDEQIWKKLATKFEEENPGVTVNMTNGDVNTESGKLTTLLQAGVSPPDAIVMYPGPGRVKILSDAGLIKPLDDLYEKNNWKDKLQPFAYDMATIGEISYELPYTLDAVQAYYNKNIFKEYNLEVPKTGEEFVKVMEELKANGVTPMNTGARSNNFRGTLYSNVLQTVSGKGSVESLIYGEKKWNDPEFIAAAETLVDWVEKDYIGKESLSLEGTDAKFSFINGDFGMLVTTSHIIVDMVEQGVINNFGTFPIPSFIEGEKTYPASGLGYSWVIPTAAENPGLAEKWLEFTLSEHVPKILYGEESFNLILASNAALEIKPSSELLTLGVERLKEGTGYNVSVFIGNETKEAFYQNIGGLLGGLVTPEDAMDDLQSKVEIDKEAGFSLER